MPDLNYQMSLFTPIVLFIFGLYLLLKNNINNIIKGIA